MLYLIIVLEVAIKFMYVLGKTIVSNILEDFAPYLPVPMPSQMHPVYIITHTFVKISFGIALPMPVSTKRSVSIKPLYAFLISSKGPIDITLENKYKIYDNFSSYFSSPQSPLLATSSGSSPPNFDSHPGRSAIPFKILFVFLRCFTQCLEVFLKTTFLHPSSRFVLFYILSFSSWY